MGANAESSSAHEHVAPVSELVRLIELHVSGERIAMPALFTTPCNSRSPLRTVSTAAAMSDATVTSSRTRCMLRMINNVVISSGFHAPAYTEWPCDASRVEILRPMPLLAPVTSTARCGAADDAAGGCA